jgi:DNA-binding MarR family transcriptional regulator
MAGEGALGRGAADRDRVWIGARVVLVARLRSRRVEIEQAIFARVQGDWFDRTGADDPEYVEGLRAAGVAGLEYVFAGVELWGRSLAPAPEAVLAQARRAARVGVGLDTVLRRYVAGHAVVEDFIVWEVGSEDSLLRAGVLRVALQAIAVLVDRLIRAVSGAYGQEAERIVAASSSASLAASPASERRSSRAVLDGSRAPRTFLASDESLKAKPSGRPSPGSRRSWECLAYLADHPDSSNSEIAAAIGIVHRSQISKLLSDLRREGLVVRDAGERPGTPTAWRLTPSGEARALSLSGRDDRSRSIHSNGSPDGA